MRETMQHPAHEMRRLQSELRLSPRKNRLIACNIACLTPVYDGGETPSLPAWPNAIPLMTRLPAHGQTAIQYAMRFAEGGAKRDILRTLPDKLRSLEEYGQTRFLTQSLEAAAACCCHTAACAARYAWSAAQQACYGSWWEHRVRHGTNTLSTETIRARGIGLARAKAHDIMADCAMPDLRFWTKRHFGNELVGMAGGCRAAMDPVEMAILADCIAEFAGGDDMADLAEAHCRRRQVHYSGCWVIDWILGTP